MFSAVAGRAQSHAASGPGRLPGRAGITAARAGGDEDGPCRLAPCGRLPARGAAAQSRMLYRVEAALQRATFAASLTLAAPALRAVGELQRAQPPSNSPCGVNFDVPLGWGLSMGRMMMGGRQI
jgi:hypothetical protein